MHRTNPESSPHKPAMLTMTTAIVANRTTTASPIMIIMASPTILDNNNNNRPQRQPRDPSQFCFFHGNDKAHEDIRNYVLKNRYTRRQPLRDISNTLNLNVYPDTIYDALLEMGLGHRIERKRPWLSDKQKANRLK